MAYSDGSLELWNIKTKSLIYTFLAHTESYRRRNGASPTYPVASITALEQSPANDVVAIGYATGEIILINLKLDRVLFSFKQTGGSVTALSFRTDPGSETFPYMASSSADGRLHVWNLGSNQEKKGRSTETDHDQDGTPPADAHTRKLAFTIEDAHISTIGRVAFLHGEPVMVSSSADNSLKMWIFDSPDGTARLLRSREGHCEHPLKIRFYGGTTNVSMRLNNDASR